MREQRTLLRRLLSALLALQQDADSLYIPRGEAGQIRMIRHLLAMTPPPQDSRIQADIRAFQALFPESSIPD